MLKEKKQRLAILSVIAIALAILLLVVEIDSTTQMMGLVIVAIAYLAIGYLILRKPKKPVIKEIGRAGRDIITALGSRENIESVDHCVTRVKVSVKSSAIVNDDRLRELGVQGVIKPSNTSVHLITKDLTEAIANELKRILND